MSTSVMNSTHASGIVHILHNCTSIFIIYAFVIGHNFEWYHINFLIHGRDTNIDPTPIDCIDSEKNFNKFRCKGSYATDCHELLCKSHNYEI